MTDINSLGEFGLIERIQKQIRPPSQYTLKGIGDDAAVFKNTPDEINLVSSEIFVEGIHFDLRYFPLRHLGYKIVVATISDIVAMNALPRQILVNMALSSKFTVEAIDELYEGIRIACEDYAIDLVGGDTTSSIKGLILSVTALGATDPASVVYRNTAKKGDILCVTGDLGGAFVGLQFLEREKQIFLSQADMQPDLEQKSYVIGRQLKPKARTDIIFEWKELGLIPTAMIDISDGLASDIQHLCKSSGLGAHIFEDKIPISEETFQSATELNLDPITCALNGGEDFELLFSISPTDYPKIERHSDIHAIGYCQEQNSIQLVTTQGTHYPIIAQGWR